MTIQELSAGVPLSDVVPEGREFFFIECPEGERFVYIIEDGRFPLAFGREIVAYPTILNSPDRIDWKACQMSEDQEKAMRSRLQSAFRPYDFTHDL